MMVSEQYKLLYCPIAKVGYSYWKRLILLLNSNSTQNSPLAKTALHDHKLGKYYPELAHAHLYNAADVKYRLSNYVKIAFVRHPLDRLLSAYEDKFGVGDVERKHFLQLVGEAIVSQCRANYVAAVAGKVPESVSFEEFLCYVSKLTDGEMNKHWRTYWSYCQMCSSSWRYDFIGEYENLSDEANFVLDMLGVKHLRYPSTGYRTDAERRQRFMKAYSAVSNKTLDAVWKKYKIDFDMFGYKLYPDFWYSNN